jgi:hypothetical protein
MHKLVVPAVVFLAIAAVPFRGRPQAQAVPAQDAPAEISADLGPCSALITVTDADSKPIYGAKMTARVQYGFAGVKKLDLEAFTGTDGKVKITRLPESLKKPMIIHVGKGDKADQVEFKPSVQCHPTFDVQLK